MAHEILFYLSKYNKLTPKIFADIWKYKDELELLQKLRGTEQLQIFKFLATQPVNTMSDVLQYFKQKDTMPLKFSQITNYWLNLACVQKNIDVF